MWVNTERRETECMNSTLAEGEMEWGNKNQSIQKNAKNEEKTKIKTGQRAKWEGGNKFKDVIHQIKCK